MGDTSDQLILTVEDAQHARNQMHDGEDPCGHKHYSDRGNWLRAGVLGANDGLVSVGALMLGVGGGSESQRDLILAGVSGLVAGALSMAAGEYVSVSSQRDTEMADVDKERQEQERGPEARAHELEELVQIYIDRGLTADLARQVAVQLTAKDPVRAHARDELGIDIDDYVNPWVAAGSSAIAFVCGAAIPLSPVFIKDYTIRTIAVVAAVTLGLVFFGALGGILGGSSVPRGAGRVLVGGWLAMAVTYAIGRLFGVDPA